MSGLLRSSWHSPRRSKPSRRCSCKLHMLQHLLLMMIAPPLLWLGAPLFPLLLGLPRSIRTYWVAPLFRSQHLASSVPVGSRTPCRPGCCSRRRPGSGIFRRPMSWPWLPTHGITSSTSVFSPRRYYSGIRSFVRFRPAPLVALAARSVLDSGRRAEHASGRLADIFGCAPLLVLRRPAATRQSLAPRRSSGRRRADVGAGLLGLPDPALRDRRPAALRRLGETNRAG